MALITQKYFSDGDSLSSSDYNSNVDNWNNSSKLIDGSNIRDQGLDIPNFDSNCCTQIPFQYSSAVEKVLTFDHGKTSQSSKEFYAFDLPDLTWATISPLNIWNDQPVYVLRQDLSWYFKMAGVKADIESTSEAQFELKWYFESGQTNKTVLVKKYIRFAGKQLAMYSGSGNISFSTILTSDMFNLMAQTNVKLECDVSFTQSSGSDMVFKNGVTHDSTVVWSSNHVKLRIKDYNISVSKYYRAF